MKDDQMTKRMALAGARALEVERNGIAIDQARAAWEQVKRDLEQLQRERDAALAQLPEGMKHCTIRFIECPVGHGRLTATNWVDSGCLVCARNAASALAEAAERVSRAAEQRLEQQSTMTAPCEFELQLLEAMIGERPAFRWGAAVGAALEVLKSDGLVELVRADLGHTYRVTDKGRKAMLRARDGSHPDDWYAQEVERMKERSPA